MLEHLRSLAVFARAIELGSFRAAARALALSPSVVSHHISELERRLARPLLYRSTRRLALTPEGAALADAARSMVEAAARGLDALAAEGANPRGTLRLTAPAFLAETGLCAELAAFSFAHPGVALELSFTDAPRDLLRDGLDLAVRIGPLADSTHRARKLADMRRVLVAAPAYVAARPPPRAPQDLRQGWDFIHLRSRPAELVLRAARRKASRSGAAPASVAVSYPARVSVDSATAMRALAVAGAGLATLPEVLVRRELAEGALVQLLPGWTATAMAVHAVWPHSAQRAGLTARFVEFLAPRVAALFSPSPDPDAPARRPRGAAVTPRRSRGASRVPGSAP